MVTINIVVVIGEITSSCAHVSSRVDSIYDGIIVLKKLNSSTSVVENASNKNVANKKANTIMPKPSVNVAITPARLLLECFDEKQ